MTEKKINKTNKSDVILYVLIAVLIGMIMSIALYGLTVYIDKSVYKERKINLTAQANTSAKLMKNTIDKYSDYVEIVRGIVEDDLHDGDDIHAYINELDKKMVLDGARLILVDDKATWYAENGTTGRITDTASYQDQTPEKLLYMTTGVDVSIESFVTRMRLNKPITVKTNRGTSTIEYCAIICYMDNMDESLSIAFPFEGNRFILDENGLMLYKDYALGILLGGTNVFSKYEKVEFLHGESGKEQLEQIKSGQITVGEFELDKENYYICTAPLNINNWSLCFVVPSYELAAGSYIKTLTIYLAVMCIVFSVAIIAAFVLLLKIQNSRYQLEVEQKANQYLEQASNAKTEFLSHMSHDIRTPINGIMGMSLLAQREDNNPKTTQCLKNIDNAAKHLLSLVNDVLDMSSIESGKQVILKNDTDLRSICEDCVNMIHGQMEDRDLELVEDFYELSHPVVKSDERKLKQILINILSNAVKYTKDGGSIRFVMKEDGSKDSNISVRFEVIDTGIGMKPEFLGHIWESFAQEDGGSRTQYKGTGLGMPITKSLVEAMGGTIEVESEYEVGSTFRVVIPFEIADADQAVTCGNEIISLDNMADIKGARILLVEDNDINQMIAKELLESEGAIVTTASDGQEAVDIFGSSESGSFDVILMDIMMPKLNGLDATRTIRNMEKDDAKTIPIVAMTANAMEMDVQNSKAAGMDAHLSKPIDLPVVIRTIARFYHK